MHSEPTKAPHEGMTDNDVEDILSTIHDSLRRIVLRNAYFDLRLKGSTPFEAFRHIERTYTSEGETEHEN